MSWGHFQTRLPGLSEPLLLGTVGAGKGSGKGNTVLDDGNDGQVLTIQAPSLVVMRNLRITGGSATGVDDAGRSGGIFVSSAQLTLTDCVITGNQAHWGVACTASGRWR